MGRTDEPFTPLSNGQYSWMECMDLQIVLLGIFLCRTMAFHVISMSLISGGDHPVLTTFCGDYPCAHYFYVP